MREFNVMRATIGYHYENHDNIFPVSHHIKYDKHIKSIFNYWGVKIRGGDLLKHFLQNFCMLQTTVICQQFRRYYCLPHLLYTAQYVCSMAIHPPMMVHTYRVMSDVQSVIKRYIFNVFFTAVNLLSNL